MHQEKAIGENCMQYCCTDLLISCYSLELEYPSWQSASELFALLPSSHIEPTLLLLGTDTERRTSAEHHRQRRNIPVEREENLLLRLSTTAITSSFVSSNSAPFRSSSSSTTIRRCSTSSTQWVETECHRSRCRFGSHPSQCSILEFFLARYIFEDDFFIEVDPVHPTILHVPTVLLIRSWAELKEERVVVVKSRNKSLRFSHHVHSHNSKQGPRNGDYIGNILRASSSKVKMF